MVKDFVIDATSPVQAPLTEDEQGGLTYRYTYGLERVSVQIGNVTTSAGGLVTDGDTVKLYYHTDRLGTYRYLTDDVKGKVTSWTDYDEWGNITHNAVLKMGKRQLDLVKNYTGHEYDNVLAKYYAKARMYDPQDKRFTQQDPAEDGLNWYAYCNNNPITKVDYDGLWTLALGASASAEAILKVEGSVQWVVDGEWNIGKVTAVGAGAGMLGVSVSGMVVATNAQTIDKLSGVSFTVGGAVSVIVASVGGAYLFTPGGEVEGAALIVSGSLEIPFNASATISYSIVTKYPLPKFWLKRL